MWFGNFNFLHFFFYITPGQNMPHKLIWKNVLTIMEVCNKNQASSDLNGLMKYELEGGSLWTL